MERLTDREVQMSIEFLVGDEYSQIGEYTGVADKMLMKHNVCGHEWEVKFRDFQNGTRCPKCNPYALMSNEKVDKIIYDLVSDEYSRISDYTGSNNKIKMRHNVCGYEYDIFLKNFKKGTRCQQCKRNKKL